MSNDKIVVFTSKGCPYCDQVTDLMKQEEVSFDEKNISEDDNYFKEWKSINPIGTPLTCYGEKQVIGFDRNELLSLIEEYRSE